MAAIDAYDVDEREALDAYSRTVTAVAERLAPSVANLRVTRRGRHGNVPVGAGSAVVLTPDGFLLTSAHVVSGRASAGRAAFVDGRGRVVGVNTAVAGVGLGLAVPINDANRRIVGALMTDGRVRRAYLGIAGGPRPLPPRVRGELGMRSAVEVVEVAAGSPAERAGLRPEDLIVAVDGIATAGVDDLQRLMVADLIGVTVSVSIVRDGVARELSLVPDEMR